MFYLGVNYWRNPDNGAEEELFYVTGEADFRDVFHGDLQTELVNDDGSIEYLLDAFDTWEDCFEALLDCRQEEL